MCAGRKGRGDAVGVSLMMQYIKQEESREFIFLALTAPNVKAGGLEDEIRH
ncbi:hypothetical protein [Staphylococcus pseudintermedius]|uniref:hypothetical protein n=1 Tax=Staphylococcus pseudintermedius TaxID=283734 RepID=UPI0015F26E69|nr:hypothetical protein [Staphylococcus pseudintermedius]